MDALPKAIVQNISSNIQTLSQQPLQELLPFRSDIRSVEQRLSELVHAIVGSEAEQDDDPAAAEASIAPNGTGDGESHACEVETDPYDPTSSISEVKSLLFAASEQLKSVRLGLADLSSTSFSWFSQDERLLHLQSIFAVLHSATSRENNLPERIMLLCACMSLASDFRDFEMALQGYAKQDVLALDVLTGSTPTPHKLGKNVRSFYESLCTLLDYRKLDAGVRLGTKLNIAMSIGERTGIGGCLAFILGLETKRLSRLPYRSFTWIELELQLLEQDPMCLSMHAFAEKYGQWWYDCQRSYRRRYDQINSGTPSVNVYEALQPSSSRLQAGSMRGESTRAQPPDFVGAGCSSPWYDAQTDFAFGSILPQ